MNRRRQAARLVRRGRLRWWLIYGPVRSGTTLMGSLVSSYARYFVSDWGLYAALGGPRSTVPATFDPGLPQRALLTEVLASCRTTASGPLDLVYKQANLRKPEYDALCAIFGPPERVVFCLRDPAGFIASAVRKFPDVDMANLREVNYVGTALEFDRIGGDVFLYHPDISGEEYASFLRPLALSPDQQAEVRYTGSSAPELTTDEMWEQFHRLSALAVNAPGAKVERPPAR